MAAPITSVIVFPRELGGQLELQICTKDVSVAFLAMKHLIVSGEVRQDANFLEQLVVQFGVESFHQLPGLAKSP